ncbi:hypothetical protein PIB30_078453, partial [Stylosanthes scabra]|nr:hypothetical protein [Stylosanthes scabra]
GMSLSSINHHGFSKQVMDEAYSYDRGYTPWNPPPNQHHTPRDDAYQSNGYGDAYYGYEDPPPPYLRMPEILAEFRTPHRQVHWIVSSNKSE